MPTKEEGRCCEWKGRKNARGYGVVLINGKQFFVHRLAVALSGRNVPKSKVCDHLCRNRACYNPDHIELVDIRENVKRGEKAQRKTCLYGHPYNDKNVLRLRKDGTRQCRVCMTKTERERKRKLRASKN